MKLLSNISFNSNNSYLNKVIESEKTLLTKLVKSKAMIQKFKVGITSFNKQDKEFNNYDKSLKMERQNYIKILNSLNKVKAKKHFLNRKAKVEFSQQVNILKNKYLDSIDEGKRYTERLKFKSIKPDSSINSIFEGRKNSIIDILIY